MLVLRVEGLKKSGSGKESLGFSVGCSLPWSVSGGMAVSDVRGGKIFGC